MTEVLGPRKGFGVPRDLTCLSAASLPPLAGVSCSFSVYLSSREFPRRDPRNRYPGSIVTICRGGGGE